MVYYESFEDWYDVNPRRRGKILAKYLDSLMECGDEDVIDLLSMINQGYEEDEEE